MDLVSVRTHVQAIRRHGLDLFRAEVRALDGTVLFKSERWSEAQARAEAARWVQKHQPN